MVLVVIYLSEKVVIDLLEKEYEMRIETSQGNFHNDITVRTFFRLIPENDGEKVLLDQMVTLMRNGEGCLTLTRIEPGQNGGQGPTFWCPYYGYYKNGRR